ncbi:MAG TPA: hypothetical protein VGY57_13215 [Vicinamibacterales bacterium]|jgi:hypothetical protein|nr:hypothetical protein [Vicinamibacterales bacterium]
MAFPWLRVLDALIGVTDIARSRRIGKLRDDSESRQLEAKAAPGALGGLETRLAGVVVAALKEAFDRDTRRLDLEREQLEAERRRAERAMRLELLRQAGDREIGRLRLVAGIAVATWIGTLFFVSRLASAVVGARFSFAIGWMLLLGAIAASFSAQSRIGRELSRLARAGESDGFDSVTSDSAGNAALWLLIAALAIIGFVAVAV